MAENEQGGMTPPFGNYSNNENTKRSKLIKSRKLAQRKEHNKRLKALYTRNKNKEQKQSFFKSLKNKATGRALFLKGKSRAVKRKLETMKEKKRNKQFKEQITLENFLGTIRNKKENEMKKSAEKYFADLAKGSEKTTQEGRSKREELRDAYQSIVSLENMYNEKIAPYIGKQLNFDSSNNAQEYSFDVSMAQAATIAREEATKIIKSKVKEAKEKVKQAKEAVGAGAGAGAAVAVSVEIDELEDLLKGLKM